MAAVVRRSSGEHVGIALSPDSVCAAVRSAGGGRAEALRVPLTPLNGDGSGWSGLTDALRVIARETGITGGRMTIALMPPLAEARSVELPSLKEAELHQLLSRSAGKYFASARGQQVVGTQRSANAPRSGGATISVVAAAASARLVNAIQDSAAAAGWKLEGIVPAEAAWAAAALQGTGRAPARAQLVVAHEDRTDLITVDQGRLSGIRRFRAGDGDARLIADAYPASGTRLSMVGNADAKRDLARALATRGIAPESVPGVAGDVEPDLLAAMFAHAATAPLLVTDRMRALRAEQIRRIATRMGIAAAVVLVLAGVLEKWGLSRELASIREQRAALSSSISSTLVGRTTVENAFRQLAALGAEERATPQWSAALAAISARLPGDAYLTGFRGRGDSVSIDGLAEHAAQVFNAIERVPTLVRVRAAGPVRIETPDDGPPLERFAIAAQLAPPPQPKTPAPRAR